jgi:hypothetical protein
VIAINAASHRDNALIRRYVYATSARCRPRAASAADRRPTPQRLEPTLPARRRSRQPRNTASTRNGRTTTTTYRYELDPALDAWITVQFTRRRRHITDYAVILLIRRSDQTHTIRVYDAAHGINEMHRYTQHDGKQAAETVHHGTLTEGLQAAIQAIQDSHPAMIEAWQEP